MRISIPVLIITQTHINARVLMMYSSASEAANVSSLEDCENPATDIKSKENNVVDKVTLLVIIAST